VVVAVVLTAALLAVSLPALDSTRRDHTDAAVEAEVERLEAAIRDVDAREQAVRAGSPGARRVLTIRLPVRSWTDAGVARLAIGGPPESTPSDGATGRARPDVVWQVAGGREHRRRFDGVRVAGRGTDGTGPLVLAEPGAHRLALSVADRDGRRVVVVRRLGDDSRGKP
jgi:hypothetical protein